MCPPAQGVPEARASGTEEAKIRTWVEMGLRRGGKSYLYVTSLIHTVEENLLMTCPGPFYWVSTPIPSGLNVSC